MNPILSEIEKSGIRIALPRAKGSLIYKGQYYDLPANSQVVFMETVFAGNTGFIKVESGDFKAVLLKGLYKDFIRILEGKPNINPTMMIKLSETASAAEKTMGLPVRLGVFACDDSTRFVFLAEKLPAPDTDFFDRRLTFMHNCFSSTEYTLYQSSEADGGDLYGRGALSGFFPETVSPLAESFLKDTPDLFNPLPMSVNVKTFSPSVVSICGKVFSTTSGLESVCETTGTTDSYYLLNYAPWLYLKTDKHSFKTPNLKVFAVNESEIEENLGEMKEESEKEITEETIQSGGLVEIFALCAMTAQLVQLKTWEAATRLFSSVKDWEALLKLVYLTREKSLLDEELEMPPYLDPFYAPIKARVKKPFVTADFDTLFSALPLSKRLFIGKDKLRSQTAELHKCLDMRDSYVRSLFGLAKGTNRLLTSLGEEMAENKLLKTPSDIFAFNLKEISRFFKDEFFGNVPSTLIVKRIKWERSRAQLVPYDIFEKDIEKIAEIAEKTAGNSSREIPAVSFFHRDYEGTGNAPERLNDPLEDIALASNFSPVLLPSLDKCTAVVTDTAPLFSYLTEYCTRTNTPLYAGVRFAGLFCKGQKISLHKNSIKIVS